MWELLASLREIWCRKRDCAKLSVTPPLLIQKRPPLTQQCANHVTERHNVTPDARG